MVKINRTAFNYTLALAGAVGLSLALSGPQFDKTELEAKLLEKNPHVLQERRERNLKLREALMKSKDRDHRDL